MEQTVRRYYFVSELFLFLLSSVGPTAEATLEATRMTAAGEPGLQTLTFALKAQLSDSNRG